jgi:hypothetical protein
MKDSNLQPMNLFHDVTLGGIHSHLHQSTLSIYFTTVVSTTVVSATVISTVVEST